MIAINVSKFFPIVDAELSHNFGYHYNNVVHSKRSPLY